MITTMRNESPGSFEMASGTLEERLTGALAKLALAARHTLRQRASRDGLSAIQAQVLALLAQEGPREMGPMAAYLGLTQATLSGSVAALEERRLVRRRLVPSDRRRVQVEATARGKHLGRALSLWPELFQKAVARLSREEKEVFFRIVIQMILFLLEKGVIQQARMCLTCVYFRPGVHDNPTRPHHCALADVPLGPSTLRLDCPEHEAGLKPAEAMDKAAIWLGAPS